MFQRLNSVRAVVLLACLVLVSCKKDALPAKGELMLAISTDMQVPKDFDSIHVEVLTYGSVQFSNDYKVGKGYLTLPATLGVEAGADPSQPVTIQVSSSKNGTVRTLREIVTTVPSNRVATIYVPIQWLCLDHVTTNNAGNVSSSCDSGETCVAGSCVTTQVDSTTLSNYQPSAVFGGGDGTGSGACFDTLQCFGGGQDAVVDLNTCTIPDVAKKGSGTGVSVAMVLAVGTEGICGPDACLVPLDADSASGWTLDGDKIQLPKAVCDRLASGNAKAVAVTTACASKTTSLPTCGDWSSVSTVAGTFDAGAPQNTGTGGTKGTGGTTSASVATGGTTSTGGTKSTGGTTNAGATKATGGTVSTGGTVATSSIGGTTATGGAVSIGGTIATSTGGTNNTGGTVATTCAGTIPIQTGGLTVDSSYVTAGSLYGYGYTFNGTFSNATTCITPTCTSTGCTPAFGTGTSAICAAGNVTADTTYNSVVGLGFDLRQTLDGTISTVTIANSITVKTYAGSGAGNAYMRVQLGDNAGNRYCVEAGSWSSGAAIPIVKFNTKCWDNTGTYASSNMPIQLVELTIPGTNLTDRPFDMCLLNVTIQ